MSAQESIIVKVPATTANLGPGFDTLGMALRIYTWIELHYAEKTEIKLIGSELQGISYGSDNLVYQAVQAVFDKVGVQVPELYLSIYSEIPLARGLGSSAAAIIGGMAAANALLDNPLSDDQIFALATSMEGHPDNVGAALFGGIVVAHWDGKEVHSIKIHPPEDLEVLLTIPEYRLSTTASRQVLPSTVSLEDAVFNLSHVALLVAAFASGQLDKINIAMKDRLHQPYRAELVPGMTEILQEATGYGALGVALSGAGPTLIAFVDRKQENKKELESYLHNTLKKKGMSSSFHRLQPASEGVTIYRSHPLSFAELIGRNSTFGS